MDEDKLEILFARKYHQFKKEASTSFDLSESWIDWCDQHKIRIMMESEVVECWNSPGAKGICIESPKINNKTCAHDGWLLVPRTFAKKALVLNGLP
jgi:hypothetical protein